MTTGSKPPGGPHTLADHLLGALASHSHDGDADHDHDHDAMPGLLRDGERDEVTLTSIGVDIGSSGTQVAFSKLHLERGDDARAAADTAPADLPVARLADALSRRRHASTPTCST